MHLLLSCYVVFSYNCRLKHASSDRRYKSHSRITNTNIQRCKNNKETPCSLPFEYTSFSAVKLIWNVTPLNKIHCKLRNICLASVILIYISKNLFLYTSGWQQVCLWHLLLVAWVVPNLWRILDLPLLLYISSLPLCLSIKWTTFSGVLNRAAVEEASETEVSSCSQLGSLFPGAQTEWESCSILGWSLYLTFGGGILRDFCKLVLSGWSNTLILL